MNNFKLITLIVAICTSSILAKGQSKKELVRFDSTAHISARLAKKNHYTYSKFDDTFSKTLFTDFLESLDEWGTVFLQEDVEKLKKYETTLDDELNGAPVRFCPEVERLFRKRLKEAEAYCKKLLSQPIDLTVHGQFLQINGHYPANQKEWQEKWRSLLTTMVEKEIYNIQYSKTKNSVNTPLPELEQLARTRVGKRLAGNNYCYLTKMSHDDYFSKYMDVFCKVLDTHSGFNNEKQAAISRGNMGAALSGIGVTLNDIDGLKRITNMALGGPAAQSGKIKEGDAILSVKQAKGNAEDVTGYPNNFLSQTIMGVSGSELSLNCERPDGTKYSVTLQRAVVNIAEKLINTAVIERNGEKIGYILFPSFYLGDFNNAGDDMINAVAKLKQEKVSAIVIDLRNNFGGVLPTCLTALGQFLPNGPVFQVKRKNGSLQNENIKNYKSKYFDGAMVVLVNSNSASCADLFPMAMQDYNRALIMGTPTIGKSIGQLPVEVKPDVSAMDLRLSNHVDDSFGEMMLTGQEIYSVTGRTAQCKGVIPDVLLPDYHNYDTYLEINSKHPIPNDSIAPAKYTAWNFGFDLAAVKKKMQEEVNHDASFKKIAENAAWLKEKSRQPISLNWEEYNAYRKEEERRINESVELTKLKDKLLVSVPAGEKAEKQMDFLNKISTDRYINTAVNAALELVKTNK